MCREEAQELSNLAASFEAKGVPMYAILHEQLGHKEFAPFFTGDLFLDEEKRFYGPKERRTLIMGLLRFSVWQNGARVKSKGIEGNLKGDGSLLGGVYLIGPGSQGILYEHRELEFGDHFNSLQLLAALETLKINKE
ncbi:unnamed protein product [Meganyctiphanes norvegica]|uniref:Peroxiredoxin-like 2A n=1 Tax=Meganyctiphanes norvegica TaxID=48144 RepID=A0AAV2RE82_MEGNR